MVYLQTTYELCFGEAYFEYFESCDFSRENTNIDVSVFMLDLRMIKMSSECEYGWYWKVSACSTEYEVCDSFVSLTRHQASCSGSAGWCFRYQSIHIQITYTYLQEGIIIDVSNKCTVLVSWVCKAAITQTSLFIDFHISEENQLLYNTKSIF